MNDRIDDRTRADALLAAIARRHPDAPVLVGDGETWRAGPLHEAIIGLAGRLAGCHTLAVLADNGPAWVIADLAALAAGVALVPLPTFFSPAQLAHVLDASGADTVLTDDPERIGALDGGFAITGRWHGLVRLQRPQPETSPLPPGTAKISFTSGSTGDPKGACLTAAGLLDTATAVATRLADLSPERHLAVLPLSLLLENTAGIHAALLAGAEIHVPGLATLGWRGMAGFDPAALQTTVERIRPATLILVPELLKAWSLYLGASGRKAPDSLVFVAVGGARVEAAFVARARQLGIPAYQGYGLTECGSVVSLNRPGDDGDDAGRPLDHVQARIVDGEIVVAARAFLGYLGQPGLHADDGAARSYATGDLGSLDAAGHIRLSGRRKNLLITSFGRNVSPEWVEAALLAQPAILQAVVCGEARPWLAAIVVPMPGVPAAALTAAIDAANAGLPDYARVGRWIASPPFTHQNGLATGNGRPRRAAILERHAAELAALYESEDITEKETAHVLL
jgi:long-chain acyl-CoA synthetase